MNVATQTYITRDQSVQVPCIPITNNINLVINEDNNIRSVHDHTTSIKLTHPFKSNTILYKYHKEFNERGHSIFKWRDEEDLHTQVAKNALISFENMSVPAPNWLNRRAYLKKI
jgi:hypothetical protein|tara:strand:+ start:170 stop:511 length:342 start_codon:yes stop_codon:yes gene_type:complete